MNNNPSLIEYSFDFVYGATRYPCALFKPKVYRGILMLHLLANIKKYSLMDYSI
jgi:hypothetical protein